ncbi:MAG: leucine-rich repeat domain-containing protein, partial [Clostridia bacterium]|nr:leucine-rich repeat domain-containing protein [Clostridia bacterium]
TNPPAHTHNWSQAWASDGTHHWHNCTASGCTVTDNSKKDGYAAHDFSDGDCICGKVKPADHSHNYKWVNNWDGTHKQHCQNEGCDAPDINAGDHTYVSTGLGSRCDKCGDFEGPEGHIHEYVWKDDGSTGTHSIYCLADDCYYPHPSSSREQHIWGENGICDKCRAVNQQLHTHHLSTEYYCQEVNHYQKCDSCNYAKPGEHEYPSEGTACSLCGHKVTTTAMNLTFKENDDRQGYTITKFEDRLGNVKDVIVPCVRMGMPVTCIAADAFKNSNITSVEISGCCLPNSGELQMTIESSAFIGCTKLKSVVIPQTVVEIERGAFKDCTAIAEMTVPFVGRAKDAENNEAQL